ncbi:MAG: HDIG domain-containing protein, partial [Gemmatimonadales bacterium]|nr:HDIG domain-containing protein [Gemmatimonadales bacterium]
VDSFTTVVLSGEKIVGEHEVVTDEAAAKIDALREVLGRRGSDPVRAGITALGALGLNVLILTLFGVICLFYRPDIYRSMRQVAFFAGAFALVAVSAGLLTRYAPGRVELIPAALPAILLAVLFDARVAAVAAMTIAALIGAQPVLAGSDALVFCFVGGVGATLSMRRIRHRTQVYAAIGVVAALYAGAAALSGAAGEESLRAIGASAMYGGVNALGSAALAMLVLPLAEAVTHSTTDLRLLELSDPDRPLLRRLATEAPGTYAHSVAMANLCEAACNAIGANGLLARVGCYYHDVGKLMHPQYFVENQGHARNPHEHLTPAQSGAVIRRHVEDGLALAQEHHLPEVIARFIPEHHGTLPISFFLERARDLNPTSSLREEDFHYPGPLPQSAETAVAMLADSVEAALRVLDDPTPEKIEDAIDHLVRNRIEAGQLREAPLTLRQVDIVQREFVRVLSGMHHNRVEYPEDAGGLTADWESGRAN